MEAAFPGRVIIIRAARAWTAAWDAPRCARIIIVGDRIVSVESFAALDNGAAARAGGDGGAISAEVGVGAIPPGSLELSIGSSATLLPGLELLVRADAGPLVARIAREIVANYRAG